MWFLKRKRTFESVVRELVEGLEDGTIVLDRPPDLVGPIAQPDPMSETAQRTGNTTPAAEPEPAERPA